MDLYIRSARRAGVVLVAVSSIVGGILLAWHMVSPESLAGTSTSQMILVLALLVLPLAALGSWQMDRLAAASSPARPEEGDHAG